MSDDLGLFEDSSFDLRVSATIATFGAIKGDKKHLNMTLLLIAVFVIPMFLGMPLVAKAIGMNQAWAGAWFGGTIDTTAAVVGAGAFYGDALKYMKTRFCQVFGCFEHSKPLSKIGC
ncbi:Uncharacterised protein [uncultured archaeon]|nr:Uncharacterised protein [uncultured archaeon]